MMDVVMLALWSGIFGYELNQEKSGWRSFWIVLAGLFIWIKFSVIVTALEEGQIQ